MQVQVLVGQHMFDHRQIMKRRALTGWHRRFQDFVTVEQRQAVQASPDAGRGPLA